MATAKRIKGHHKKIIGGGKTKWRLPTELKATTKINQGKPKKANCLAQNCKSKNTC